MGEMDRLERAWRELQDEIKRAEESLDSLKAKFEKLDAARAVLIAMTPEDEMIARARASDRSPTKRGLQDAVFECIDKCPNDNGVGISDIANALRAEFGSRYRGRSSFLASIFVAVTRLMKQNRVQRIQRPEGKRYFSK